MAKELLQPKLGCEDTLTQDVSTATSFQDRDNELDFMSNLTFAQLET